MKRAVGKKISIVLLLIFFSGVSSLPTQAAVAEPQDTVRLMIEVRDEPLATGDQLTTLAPRIYTTPREQRRAHDLRRWRTIETTVEQSATLYNELKANPAVATVYVEPQYHAALLPNDPGITQQYGIASSNPLADIKATAAWDRTTGSTNTIIAIVDGGVDLTHEDLRDKVWVNTREIAGNRVDDDGNGFIDDVHGWDFVANRPAEIAINHATHVAGIAGATSNNGVGVTGVDWQARLMSVRVLGSGGAGGEAAIIKGIAYAVQNGAKVINLSLVGSPSPALSAAVENAYAAGVVVVAAAGNSGVDLRQVKQYPVCSDVGGVDMVLGVAATDEKGKVASFSNYGDCINVAAPGDDIYSTKAGNKYGTMTGTSMSAPFAAGVAGLYLSLHPGASPAEVIAALTNSGDDIEAGYGHRLNAAKAVGASVSAGTNPEPSSNPAPSSGGGPSTDSGSQGEGGGGGEEPQSVVTSKKGAVKGVSTKISNPTSLKLRGARAKDVIPNKSVPAVVSRLFAKIFSRKISPKESTYWKQRARSDKPTQSKLIAAMLWHKMKGKLKK